MNLELKILCLTAATIGFFHTLLGPDHYIPFVVMAKARKWSTFKTGVITVICGLGHVMSSIVIGMIGIFFGIKIMRLEALETFRGDLAAWALIGFGLTYFVWGIHRAIKKMPHEHIHSHDGITHSHTHTHGREHAHVHREGGRTITPWILFTIFVLGPCEPLIPLLMYPAAKSSVSGLLIVTGIFTLTTILTMISVVFISSIGISFIPIRKIERYTHAIAGATISLSGLAIYFLGV